MSDNASSDNEIQNNTYTTNLNKSIKINMPEIPIKELIRFEIAS